MPTATATFRDGLGSRVRLMDPVFEEPVDRHYLAAGLQSQEAAVRDRATRLANFRHVRFPRLRGVDRDTTLDGEPLYVAADPVEGRRLSEVLDFVDEQPLTLDVNAALQVPRELLPALAVFHDSRNVTHGCLGPERLVLTPQGRVMIVEHALGLALEKVQYPRTRLWREFRVAMPPSAGLPRFDTRSDVAEVALVTFELILGRRLRTNEFPDELRTLLDEAVEHLATGTIRPLSAGLYSWFERALPLQTRRPFNTALDAQVALEEVIKKERAYAPSSGALKAFLQRFDTRHAAVAPTPTPQPVEAPAGAGIVPRDSAPAFVVPPPKSREAPRPRRETGPPLRVVPPRRRLTPEEEEEEEIRALEAELARLARLEADAASAPPGAIAGLQPADAGNPPGAAAEADDPHVTNGPHTATVDSLMDDPPEVEVAAQAMPLEPRAFPHATAQALALTIEGDDLPDASVVDTSASPAELIEFVVPEARAMVLQEPAPGGAECGDLVGDADLVALAAAEVVADADLVGLAAADLVAEAEPEATSTPGWMLVPPSHEDGPPPAEETAELAAFRDELTLELPWDAEPEPVALQVVDRRLHRLLRTGTKRPRRLKLVSKPVTGPGEMTGGAQTLPVRRARRPRRPTGLPASPVLGVLSESASPVAAAMAPSRSRGRFAAMVARATLTEEVQFVGNALALVPAGVVGPKRARLPLALAERSVIEEATSLVLVPRLEAAATVAEADFVSATPELSATEAVATADASPVDESQALEMGPSAIEVAEAGATSVAADVGAVPVDASVVPVDAAAVDVALVDAGAVDATAVDATVVDAVAVDDPGLAAPAAPAEVESAADAAVVALVEPGGAAGPEISPFDDIDPALLALLEEVESAEEIQAPPLAEEARTGVGQAEAGPTLAVPELLEVLAAIAREVGERDADGEPPAVPSDEAIARESLASSGDADEVSGLVARLVQTLDRDMVEPTDAAEAVEPHQMPDTVAPCAEGDGDPQDVVTAGSIVADLEPGASNDDQAPRAAGKKVARPERKRRRARKSRPAASLRETPPSVEVVRLVPARTERSTDASSVPAGPDAFAAPVIPRPLREVVPTIVSAAMPPRRSPSAPHADVAVPEPADSVVGLVQVPASPSPVVGSEGSPTAGEVSRPVAPAPPASADASPGRVTPPMVARTEIPSGPVDGSRGGDPAELARGEPSPIQLDQSPSLPQPAASVPPPAAATESGSADEAGDASQKPLTATVEPPRRWFDWRRVNWRRTAAAVVLLGLVEGAAFAAAYWMVRPSDLGVLVVSTSTPGVDVVVDGKPSGKTPLSLELAPGRHSIELRGQGGTKIVPVEIAAGVQTHQLVNWPDSRPAGSLKVTSTPPGARVVVAGLVRGTTPLVIDDLDAGGLEVLVESDAGSVREHVRVRAGQMTEVDLPIFSGWLAVFAPVELRIFAQGRMIGTTLDGRIMMPPGRHEIEFVNATLGIRETRSVEIRPGKVEAVSLEAPNGTLMVDAPAGTEVMIDGQRAGVTPLQGLTLPVGTHEVVLRHPMLGQRRVVVSIGVGTPANVSLLAPQ